jgi:hypothetical protein
MINEWMKYKKVSTKLTELLECSSKIKFHFLNCIRRRAPDEAISRKKSHGLPANQLGSQPDRKLKNIPERRDDGDYRIAVA